MTPAQIEHLKRIDAHLERLLAIAAKRTPGEWHAEIYDSLNQAFDDGGFEWAGRKSASFPAAVGSVWQGSKTTGFTGLPGNVEVGAENATFIASCAGNAEAGWRATRAAIAAILGCRICGGTGITSGWVPSYADPSNITMAPEAEPCCEHAKDILAAWPLELLETKS